MSALTMFAAILLENEGHAEEAINRRILRDRSNPLEVPESIFVSSYRVNKDAFIMLLNITDPHIRSTTIPTHLQLAATLRFPAEGGFQKAVGKDNYIAMERSTVAKVIKTVLRILEKYLCPRWIKIRMTESELTQPTKKVVQVTNVEFNMEKEVNPPLLVEEISNEATLDGEATMIREIIATRLHTTC